jgi:hypothetical protein
MERDPLHCPHNRVTGEKKKRKASLGDPTGTQDGFKCPAL